MTSNPRFAQYVERVQENLAMFSLSNKDARTFLRRSDSIALYNPSFIVFEILINHRENKDSKLTRMFDPHVSSKLLERFTVDKAPLDIERLNANSELLEERHRPLNRKSIDWSLAEDTTGEFSNLRAEVEHIFDVHEQICGKHTHEKSLAKLAQTMRAINVKEHYSDLRKISKTLKKLVRRYERHYLPTNLAASAILYEAWKFGNLQALGNPADDVADFDTLLDALFIHIEKGEKKNFLTEMAKKMKLPHLYKVGKGHLDNGERWIRYPKESWVTWVESSLIYGHLIRRTPPDTYIIHFPLIIDNYRFVGFCYLVARLEKGQELTEIFIKEKYPKFYCMIQSVSETLRLSLREDALDNVTECLETGQDNPEKILAQVLQDYFVCFDVLRDNGQSPNDVSKDSLNTKVLYQGHDLKIYGPEWVSEDHKKLMREEIDGPKDQLSFNAIPGLYQDAVSRIKQFEEEQRQAREKGKEEQASLFSHQAAGLVAEAWCDPKMQELRIQSQGCLWQLKTLIDLWGNFDLEEDIPLSGGPQDFPNSWINLNGEDLLQNLINIGITHALRRATYRRSGGDLDINDEIRQKAFEISKSPNRIPLFRKWINLKVEKDNHSGFPYWLNYRGFVICFHHCFWQSAFHGFRARCGVGNSEKCFVKVQILSNSVTISNRKMIIASHLDNLGSNKIPRDAEFYMENLRTRFKIFEVDGPRPISDLGDTWQATISYSQSC